MAAPVLRRVPSAAAIFLGLLTLTSCDSEPAAWTRARTLDTVASYQEYLDAYPGGAHVVEARQTSEELHAWMAARAANRIDSLESFLRSYPESPRRLEATGLLTPLVEARDWVQATQLVTVEALQGFLVRHPAGAHAPDAKGMLAEAEAWNHALAQRSAPVVQAFLKAHPDSVHREAAGDLLRAMAWADASVTNGSIRTVGRHFDGYARFVSELTIQHELACPLGRVTVRCVLKAERGVLDASRDGSRIARNGADVAVSGEIVTQAPTQASNTTRIVGLVWGSDDNLLGSHVYSYDTHLGASNPRALDGLVSSPPLDPAKAVCLLKIMPGGFLQVQP